MRRFVAVFAALAQLHAAEHKGAVLFGGQAVPGVSITLTQGETSHTTITDPRGTYSFSNLADGAWTAEAEMQLFERQRQQITLPNTTEIVWELTVSPPANLSIATREKAAWTETKIAAAKINVQKTENGESLAPPSDNLAQRAADGFLINGSVNNGAASPFALLPAFGNHRRGPRSLYKGNLGLIANTALFDARAFSITGQNTPKPDYSRTQSLFSFGGPIRLPGLIRRNGPNFTVNYQRTQNSNAKTQTALMPTSEQRASVPASRVSPQARTLLDLYPLPNFTGDSRYNYQVAILSGLHQDDLQTRVTKQHGRNYYAGSFAWQSTRTDTTDVFGFLETASVAGVSSNLTYRHNVNPRTFFNLGLQYSRLGTEVTPFFANRRNVSAEAGIAGNNQDPANWGPPNLVFSSGIASLISSQASLMKNQTTGASADAYFNRGRHNITLGVTVRRQQFNAVAQQDARGTFAFTGPEDFSSFLEGIPQTTSIAFGNADKYLRARTHEVFLNNDWRVNPGLTINAGVRWERWSPVTEKYGRLVNLAIGPGFATASPVIARDANGVEFPQPDRNNFAPRVAFSWRPWAASSMVVRAGYGIYYDTSVYQTIAMQMAQQSPLSRSLRMANDTVTPLNLASAFLQTPASATQSTTFGVDPGFRVGYSQNWNLSIQRDLPAGLQLTASYNGGKGTRAPQRFLPNTFPDGATEPAGYTYLTSNGNAIRHAAQGQLRRRLRSGFTASLQYTYAKSVDNAASLGGRDSAGTLLAQNWLDLNAERARSNFDQRHLLNTALQYTSGMGARGGTLLSGWRAALLKEWTFGANITVGSGLPLTPILLRPVSGTGVTGSIRPDYSGAPLYEAPEGLFLNPSAYAEPAQGRWGNAGRNSITGPAQFALNASLGRTFRSTERVSLDIRVDATNALNTVVYTAWNTTVGNSQFGVPTAIQPMRAVQAVVRTRF